MGSENKTIGTPYDDAFRTMLVDCVRLVIPVINEIFGKHYTGQEEIIPHPNEHFIIQQEDEEKRITDGNFTIRGEQDETYLFECQSTPDSTMLIRVWEYIAQIAVEQGTVEKDCLFVRIPDAAVLYLRSSATTSDQMKIVIKAPTGSLSFPIRVMKIKDYTLEEILEKKLYFLIPFYIFTHESEFESQSDDPGWLEKLKQEYVLIRERLDEAVQKGEMPYHYYWTIIEMTKKVLESIAVKHDRIREGVSSIMGGKVLEYESKTIYREGLRDGEEKGRQEGRLEGRQEGLRDGEEKGRQEERENISVKLYNCGMPVEQIAETIGVPVATVKQWIAKHTA